MGGAPPPDLVKNTSPAKALVVGGFSDCASILTSDSLMDLDCFTSAVPGCSSPVSSGGSPPSLKMCSSPGPETKLHLQGSYEPAVSRHSNLLVKSVPGRVVTPLSYSSKDFPCLFEAASEPFFSDPAGDVYMGGTIPLVNIAAPAMVPLVGGFSKCASMDLGCQTDVVPGRSFPTGEMYIGGTSPKLDKVQNARRLSELAALSIGGNSSGVKHTGGSSFLVSSKNVYKPAASSCSYVSKLAGGGSGNTFTFPS